VKRWTDGQVEDCTRGIGSLGSVAAVAVASRILVILAGRFASRHLLPDPTAPAATFAVSPWFRWDAVSYLQLASQGYTGETSTAFFPLYPLLGFVLSRSIGVSPEWALLILSNSCFAAACLVLFDLVRREVTEEAALIAVASLCFFPPTVFLSVAYSESLFLLLTGVTFRLLQAGMLCPAALVAGLAAAARPLGWALAFPVMVEAWCLRRPPTLKALWRCSLLGLVSLWGLCAYMGYLGVTYGDPLLVFRAHFRWHSQPVESLWAYLPWRLFLTIVGTGSREALVNVIFFLGFALLTIASVKRLPGRYTAFSLPVMMLLYWRAPFVLFQGANRHILSMATVYLSIGVLLSRRSGYALAVISLFAGLSVFWTALYFQGYLIR